MTLRYIRLALAVVAGSGGAACADQVPGNPAPTAQVTADSTVLAPGDAVVVDGLRLVFLTVSEDSRCPIDVVCVWQGNAAVEVRAGLDGEAGARYTLNTSDAEPQVDVAGHHVRLVHLLPAPRAATATPAGAYRATFRIERMQD
jgi:hypothetical protein